MAVLLLAVQLGLLAWSFPASALFSDVPLLHIDGAYHWYQIHVAHELASRGRLTGYDPFFAAGYLGGTTLNASAKVPSLLAFALGGIATDMTVYKAYVFVSAAIAPSLIVLAAGVLAASRSVVCIAGALGLLLWWASRLHWYHTAGMVSFVLATYLAVLYSALVRRTVLDRQAPLVSAGALGLLGAAGLFLHPLFPIPVIIAVLCCLAVEWREVSGPRLVKVFLITAGVGLAPNLPWVASMLSADTTVVGLSPYQRTVDITIIPRELAGVWSMESMGAKINAGLFVASLAAAMTASSRELRRFSMASLAAWLLLELFATVGAALPGVGPLQPNRFSTAAYVFLVVPASLGVVSIASALVTAPGPRKAFAIAAGVVVAISLSLSAWELTREVSHKPVGHYGQIPPEAKPLGEQARWIIDWLSKNTDPAGRILFETSKARIHDNSHMAGYFAIASGREFIGGPYAEMFYAGFTDGKAFGQRLESMTPSDFGRMLVLYNVGWIVAHSADARRFLASIPAVEAMESAHGIQTYRVRQPLTYFLVGSGSVHDRGINRVTLEDLKGSEAVIKYHYVRGLTANPPAVLEPYQVPGIPQPFVRISAIPGARIELSIR